LYLLIDCHIFFSKLFIRDFLLLFSSSEPHQAAQGWRSQGNVATKNKFKSDRRQLPQQQIHLMSMFDQQSNGNTTLV
jgi:hypothetical protein